MERVVTPPLEGVALLFPLVYPYSTFKSFFHKKNVSNHEVGLSSKVHKVKFIIL